VTCYEISGSLTRRAICHIQEGRKRAGERMAPGRRTCMAERAVQACSATGLALGLLSGFGGGGPWPGCEMNRTLTKELLLPPSPDRRGGALAKRPFRLLPIKMGWVDAWVGYSCGCGGSGGRTAWAWPAWRAWHSSSQQGLLYPGGQE
jgi:hypothetical protein